MSKQILEIITRGIPFLIFKSIAALHLYREDNSFYLLFAVWALLDFLLNMINLSTLLLTKRAHLRFCILNYFIALIFNYVPLQQVGERDLGTSLDILLVFLIVAFMLVTGESKNFTQLESYLWNFSVVLHVLTNALIRLSLSTQRVQRKII